MTKTHISAIFSGFLLAITSIFLISIGNNAFAIDYSKYANNEYVIEFYYPNILPSSFEQRDNNMIIHVGANFKDSNNAKIVYCAQSYHKMIPKIYQDSESYWEGSAVACAYGMYNYNVNIGDKNVDPLLQIQIEGEAQLCMFDDHCMKKIKDILKGKIALEYEFPTIKNQSPEEHEQWYIEYCAKQFFKYNHLTANCKDRPAMKEKIEIEIQKLKENNSN